MTTVIPQVPEFTGPAPTRADPDNFSQRGDKLMTELVVLPPAMNESIRKTNLLAAELMDSSAAAAAAAKAAADAMAAAQASAASALAAPGTNATSATSINIGAGTISLTVQTGKSFGVGAWLMVAVATDVTKWMIGRVVSYNSATGTLVLSVTAGDTSGTGTYANWAIAQTSAPGSVLRQIESSNVGPRMRPTVLHAFANSKMADPRLIYAMSTVQTYFDEFGVLRSTVAPNQICYDHDPATGVCRGIPFFEARTNHIRNNTAAGGAAGTPGTDPTNWIVNIPSGCQRTVTAVGTWKGIEYFQIRCYGTVNAAGQMFTIHCDSNAANGIAASGQTWTHSAFVQLQAGSLVNTNFQIGIDEMTAGGAFLTGNSTPFAPSSSIPLAEGRYTHARTLTQATTGALRVAIYTTVANGATVDFTITVALPQVERSSNGRVEPTSPIKTSNGVATRALPVMYMDTTPDWYNPYEGTLFVKYMKAFSSWTGTMVALNKAGVNTDFIQLRDGSGPGGSPGSADFLVLVGGVNQADASFPSTADGVMHELAVSYKNNDFAGSLDGGAVAVDTGVSLPSGINQLCIGCRNSADGGDPFNGWIHTVSYYAVACSDAETVALASQ